MLPARYDDDDDDIYIYIRHYVCIASCLFEQVTTVRHDITIILLMELIIL